LNRRERRAAAAQGRAFKNPLGVHLLPLNDPASEGRAAEIVAEQRRLLQDPTLSPEERASIKAAEARAVSTWKLLALCREPEPMKAAS
jgi:hypothetical protein